MDTITTMMNMMPKMMKVRRYSPRSSALDVRCAVRDGMARTANSRMVAPGMRIAVGVGSRGISNLAEAVKAVLEVLKEKGAKPFIVPAMGSHGGATPEGQEKVLAQYGITRQAMDVPLETGMEVVTIGTTALGGEVVFSAAAAGADAIVVINRVKPHTDFYGELGSGLQKMLAIGLGKHVGAVNAHRASSRLGHEAVIGQTAKVIIEKMPVLFGVALLEDQHHETADIQVIGADEIVEQERKLLVRARALVSHLPFEKIDLLIVDKIGKEISGTGMDTNVIGRGVLGYIASLEANGEVRPQIFRIFVRDLTEATNGNGIGLGLADFTTGRAVRALNLEYMYTNAITSLGLPTAKIPMYFETDRQVLAMAVASLATGTPERLRIVRIVNTLEMDHLLISEALVEEARGRGQFSVVEEAMEMAFDDADNLLPFA